MKPISLVGTASAMPETIVTNDFFEIESDTGKMFKGTRERRHTKTKQMASDLIVSASEKLFDRLNLDAAKDVDIILTNVSIPDLPFTGCGAEIAYRLGCNAKWVLDVHNTGCVSFIFMMELARSLMASGAAKTALICNVQTAAGRIFGQKANRSQAQSAVPGDGCGVGYLTANNSSPLQSVITRNYGEYACDMEITSEDQRMWWQPGASSFRIDFSRRKIGKVVRRANSLVPGIIRDACEIASLDPKDINLLITNQPNPYFLRNWREALNVSQDNHIDTFEEHGNLFGAAMPIIFERATEQHKLKAGDNIVFGGFSHAGDYAAAAVVKWQAKSN